MHYLDHNATSPIRPEAQAALIHALSVGGNASSVHARGRAARALIEEAKEKVALLANAAGHDVIFTSGATEAANLGLAGAVEAPSTSMRPTRRLRASPGFSSPPSSTARWRRRRSA